MLNNSTVNLHSVTPLNIIFAGTPHFAAHHLQSLIDSPHNIVAVYTQPDRPSGRGKKLTPSPVKSLALEHGLTVEQPASLKGEGEQATLAAYQADVMVVVAYGLLLPQAVLDIPSYGCLNVHGSLLPRWRGAAPIQRAVEAGDSETGITIMQMDKGLDTGDMLLKVVCATDTTETSASLHDKLMRLGAPALLETLERLSANDLAAEKQDDSQANYAQKITKQEADIDWQRDGDDIMRKVRAFNPFPIAYTGLNGQRIKVHGAKKIAHSQTLTPGTIISVDDQGITVACNGGAIVIEKLQIPNKKAMTVKELLNGYSDYFQTGQQLMQLHGENT